MADRKTQESRSSQSTARLLDAAESLVADRGYRYATLAEIGRKAGYSRGLVTQRFGSKDSLMWALVIRSTERWYGNLITPNPDSTGLENIRAMFDSLTNHIETNSTSFRALQRLIMDAHESPKLDELFRKSRSRMERSIQHMLRQGTHDLSIRPKIDVVVEAQTVLAALRGIGYEAFLYPDVVDARKLYDHYLLQVESHIAGSSQHEHNQFQGRRLDDPTLNARSCGSTQPRME